MQGRIIIFGSQRFGRAVAEQLAAAQSEVVLVGQDAVDLATARESRLTVCQADYTDDAELERLGIGRDVGQVFCLLPEDAQNVFLSLSVRALAPQVHIVALAEAPDAVAKLKAAGADDIIEPYEMIGQTVCRLVQKPLINDLLDTLLFGDADLLLAEVAVTADSALDQSTLLELNLRDHYNLVALGVANHTRGETLLFAADAQDYRLLPGDVLLVMGADSAITRFRRAVAVRRARKD